jgi:hypothetical protein
MEAAAEAAFAELCSSIKRDVSDPVAAAAVCARLQRFWDTPPCAPLEFVLRRGVGPASARALLFAPDALDEGMGLYPLLVRSAPPGAPESHPLRALQVPFLSLLPTHLHDWRRAAAFVSHGGLAALAALLMEPALPLRVQAIEVMLQITSHKGFAWFEAPAEGDDAARRLHAAVLALAQPAGEPGGGAAAAPFLSALLANWDNPLPGASFNCLQLAAWWLSWVRLLHTGGAQELRLSRPLLEALRAWAERPVAPEGSGEEGAAGGGGGGGGGAAPPPRRFSLPEEAALAAKVYEDFSRFPAEGEPAGGGRAPRAAPSQIGGVAGIAASSAALPAPLPATPAALRAAVGALREEGAAPGEAAAPADSAAALKEEGNAHFRGERWVEAARAYGRGIALLARAAGASAPPRELLLALLSNRALARLRSSGYGGDVAPSAAVLRGVAEALEGGGGGYGARGRALAALREAADAVGGAAAGEEEEEEGAPAAARSALFLGRQPILGIFGCLVDCARALALDGGHVKCLFRRAQAFLALRAAGEALRAARACVARARERGAAGAELLAQATSLLSYGVAMQSSAGGEGGEEGGRAEAAAAGGAPPPPPPPAACGEEGEDAILSALMQRAEFGGSGGGGGGGDAGVGPAAPPPPPPQPPQPQPQPPPQPHAPAAAGAPQIHFAAAAPAAQAPASAAPAAPPNVEDVLAGRAATRAAKKPAPVKTFSLPPP